MQSQTERRLPPPPPAHVKREKAIRTWRHVTIIAKEMKRQGTSKVADALRQTARSNINNLAKNMDMERALIPEEGNEDYFIDDEGEEEEDVEMSE